MRFTQVAHELKMEHWKEIPLNKNNEVELSAADNITLHHGYPNKVSALNLTPSSS